MSGDGKYEWNVNDHTWVYTVPIPACHENARELDGCVRLDDGTVVARRIVPSDVYCTVDTPTSLAPPDDSRIPHVGTPSHWDMFTAHHRTGHEVEIRRVDVPGAGWGAQDVSLRCVVQRDATPLISNHPTTKESRHVLTYSSATGGQALLDASVPNKTLRSLHDKSVKHHDDARAEKWSSTMSNTAVQSVTDGVSAYAASVFETLRGELNRREDK